MMLVCELWSINRWLRFTGWRLVVATSQDPKVPTRIGFKFWGWRNW